MYYTVSDFYNTYKDTMRVICGKGGFSRRISSVGILDYEFLPEVSGKYKHYNFDEGQLVVSTLMYARDNQALIGDAIRNLINAGVSGLVVKDIFRIRIPETIARYAEARNFPIFYFDSRDVFIEDIIFDVKTSILRQSSASRIEEELDIMTSGSLSEQEVSEHARLISPSFETQHRVYYLFYGEDLSRGSFSDQYIRFEHTALDIPESLLTPYGRGLLYITSWEHGTELEDEEVVSALRDITGISDAAVGISSTHYYLGELGYSVREAMYASLMAGETDSGSESFDSLGVMKVIFPLSGNRILSEYSEGVLEGIRDHDLENNSKLMETLAAWSKHEMSFPEAASELHQHENTLRYRMDKIAQITGLDFKRSSEAEQLHLAYIIDYCRSLVSKL